MALSGNSINPASDYTDGDFSELIEVDGAITEYPFLGNTPPDKYARIHTRPAEVDRGSYVPHAAERTSYTNLALHAAAFTESEWETGEATITPNVAANPIDGTLTRSLLLETSATDLHFLRQVVSLPTDVWHVFSLFVQAAGRTSVRLSLGDGAGNTGRANFDLLAGAVTSQTVVGIGGGSMLAGVLASGIAGVWRCWVAFNRTSATTTALLTLLDGTSTTYAGDPTKGVLVWGAQLEAGTAPGPVILTGDSTVTISAPPLDPEDSFAYLVEEVRPQIVDVDLLRVVRTYARIPATQYDFTTRWIPKPEVPEGTELVTNVSRYAGNGERPAVGVGALHLRQSTDRNYLWSPTAEFFGPATISAVAFARVNVTGGTFTVTYKGQTTAALAYNETGANIATAINALSTVTADGFVVTVTNSFTSGLGLQIARSSGANIPAEFSLGAASLTPASAAIHFISYTALNTQVFRAAYVGTLAAHGYSASVPLLTYQESTDRAARVYPVGRWAVVDANTLAVDRDASQTGSVDYFVAPYLRAYTPGNVRATLRVVSSFYLPGVTAGIAADDDIPLPVSREDTNAFLEALLANTAGYQDYSGDDRARWLGPIRRQDALQLDFSTL